jgi:hypothetical protein
MKMIIGYHAYMFGSNYMTMMAEQFQLLISSGLYNIVDKIYIGIVDTPGKNPSNGIEWVNNFWKFASSKVEIVVYPDNKEETRTLEWIKNYSANNPNDYVLYFHTKGISYYTQPTEDWRRYMEYFVIEHWKNCIQKLDEGYDCCGVRWHVYSGVHPHFSGGMWWAKTSYINKLAPEFLTLPWRFYREFWIGSNVSAKVFQFHDNRINPYAQVYPRCNYEHLL